MKIQGSFCSNVQDCNTFSVLLNKEEDSLFPCFSVGFRFVGLSLSDGDDLRDLLGLLLDDDTVFKDVYEII